MGEFERARGVLSGKTVKVLYSVYTRGRCARELVCYSPGKTVKVLYYYESAQVNMDRN